MSATGFGKRVSRVEDPELVAGSARFVDDFNPDGTLHVAIVRSQMASADVALPDLAPALSMPGVTRIVSHDDVADLRWDQLLPGPPQRMALADTRVRYHGDPVAAVVAEDRHRAHDAQDMLWLDYEPRAAVISSIDAMADRSTPISRSFSEALDAWFSSSIRSASDLWPSGSVWR